jgi:excisionase family DNA binding protein
MEKEKLLTLREVAEYLRVSLSYVQQLSAKRKLPVIKIGRVVRIRQGELESWLESMKQNKGGIGE